jgi:phage N-6-adenine-methyltransferase
MSDLWYTPKELINCITKYTGRIGFDPASCQRANENVNAQLYLTEKQNGLILDWVDWVTQADNQLIWVNPPYSKEAGSMNEWSAKIIRCAELGIKTLALVNARTDTNWFHNMMNTKASNSWVAFFNGRIKFELEGETDKNSPRHNNSLFMYNVDPICARSIAEEFSIVKPCGIRDCKMFYI